MNKSPGFIEQLPQTPKKIAILRASRIGDFICATPAFRALRKKFPEAEISLIALPMLQSLAERSPHLDRFIPFPGFPGIAEQLYNPMRAREFLAKMQKENFDLVIQMHGSGRFSNPIALQFQGRCTVGFTQDENEVSGLDCAYPYVSRANEITRLLNFLEHLGIQEHGHWTEFIITQSDYSQAEPLLGRAKEPVIGIHPSAYSETKKWPTERFANVGRQLIRKWGGQLVLLGDKQAAAHCKRIAEQVGDRVVSLAGETSLPVLGALISRLDLFISNDSGPAHIAYALRVPSITLFGSTDPSAWGPMDDSLHKIILHPVDCRPCEYVHCPIGNACLLGIKEEEVLRTADDLLKQKRERKIPLKRKPAEAKR